jgi:hypothetical protein
MSIDKRSQGPPGTHSGSGSDRQSPSILGQEAVARFEALAQRIADTPFGSRRRS